MDKLSENTIIYNEDAFKILPIIESESVDVIATDPPYFLSNDGISCQNGKIVSVNKGEWDKNSVSVEEFYSKFLYEAKRILKPEGTIWVFGTMHNIYYLGYLLQKLDFKILNNITWQKTNPAPNLSCKMFTHSTETVLWARREPQGKHYFNYDLMKAINGGKQMKDVWITSTTPQSEKRFGKHSTQKPLEIMERIILASSKEGEIILDPFMGSGTTLEAAVKLNRKSIGIELEKDYYAIAKERISNRINDKQLSFLQYEGN